MIKRVLITGGTGFIGRALAKRLEAKGADVWAVGRIAGNLTHAEETDAVFTAFGRFDYILHCADLHGDARWSVQHQADQILHNTAMALNVLESWRRHQPQARFVAMGSVLAYPRGLELVSEDQYWDGPPAPEISAYAVSKRLLSSGVSAVKLQHGLHGTTLILGNVYSYDGGDRSTRLVPTVLRQIRDGGDITLWTTGEERRPFIQIDDQVDRILAALDYGGDLLNVGPALSTTVAQMVEHLRIQTHHSGRVVYGREVGASCTMDTTRFDHWTHVAVARH